MPPTAPPRRSAAENVSVAEAERLLAEAAPRLPESEVPLAEAAGRILREELVADRPFPPYDRVTMDGVAISFAAWRSGLRSFRVAGIQPAGRPALELPPGDGCIEVMTGAVLPRGADCVVPVECVTTADGWARVDGPVHAGQHVHRAGSDRAAGEALVRSGVRLAAPEIAVAASVGKVRLLVSRRPVVAVASTGDELVEAGAAPEPHQIRRSNPHAIRAALGPVADVSLAHLPDEAAALREGLRKALEGSDLVLVTGGVSRGRFDLVPEALASLGVAAMFHRVRQRPGRPMWAGRTVAGQLVLGLPGNPVSVLVTLHRYVLPLLAPGPALSAELDGAVAAEEVRFVPVRLRCEAGRMRASPVEANTSGDLAALAGTDGFVQAEEGGGRVCRLWCWAGRGLW